MGAEWMTNFTSLGVCSKKGYAGSHASSSFLVSDRIYYVLYFFFNVYWTHVVEKNYSPVAWPTTVSSGKDDRVGLLLIKTIIK